MIVVVGRGASPGRSLRVDVRQIPGLLQSLSHFFGQTKKISAKQVKNNVEIPVYKEGFISAMISAAPSLTYNLIIEQGHTYGHNFR